MQQKTKKLKRMIDKQWCVEQIKKALKNGSKKKIFQELFELIQSKKGQELIDEFFGFCRVRVSRAR